MYNLINQKLFYRVNAIIPEIQQDKIRNIFYTLLFLKKYALKNNQNELVLDIDRHITVLYFVTDKMWLKDVRKGCLSEFKQEAYNVYLKYDIDKFKKIPDINIEEVNFNSKFLKHLYNNNIDDINIILQQIEVPVKIK